jgi:hypothetical protein
VAREIDLSNVVGGQQPTPAQQAAMDAAKECLGRASDKLSADLKRDPGTSAQSVANHTADYYDAAATCVPQLAGYFGDIAKRIRNPR